jgi:hypothetical protein
MVYIYSLLFLLALIEIIYVEGKTQYMADISKGAQ